MSDLATRIDQEAVEGLLVSQWSDATRLQALIHGFLDVIREGLVDPLAYLERQLRYTTAEGIWMDLVGRRVGCRRLSVLDTSFDRFGFDDAGVGFDQGPFDTTNPSLSSRVPIDDSYYLCFIEFCAQAILSDGSRPSLEAALQCSFEDARIQDNADGTVTIHNVADDPRPNLATLAEPMIRAAMPAGITVTLAP